MPKPTPTQTNHPGKPAPKPVDDPLAQLIDRLSDEVEPVATTSEAGKVEAPGTSEGDTGPTA